jgi:hypothetical protein
MTVIQFDSAFAQRTRVARMEKVEWRVVDLFQLLSITLLFVIDDDFPDEREEFSEKEPANRKRRRYASHIQRDIVSRTDCLERAAV